MRHESARGCSPHLRGDRGPRAPWRIGVVAILAATGFATALHAEPQAIDLTPLLEVQTDPSRGLTSAFSDYDALVIDGVQRWNGRMRRDGVVELFKDTYDSEVDQDKSWTVDVNVTLFDTAERAARDLDSSCYPFSRGGASGGRVHVRKGVYCVSPVVQSRTDPQNLYLPANLYSSWVFVRRDRLVVRMYERNKGSAKSAKNSIIVELAERLSRLRPTSASN